MGPHGFDRSFCQRGVGNDIFEQKEMKKTVNLRNEEIFNCCSIFVKFVPSLFGKGMYGLAVNLYFI